MATVKVGDSASLSRTIREADIEAFARLVGDTNPLHLDDGFARRTRFGKRVAHGMWAASLISAVLGTKLPGPGTIYLSQTLQFKAPVYPEDAITAQVTVTDIRQDKPIVTLDTVCMNQRGEVVLRGQAVVLVDQLRDVAESPKPAGA